MVTIKTADEIVRMRRGGKILADVLASVAGLVAPGVSAAFLNAEAEKMIAARGAESLFLGYKPEGALSAYPAALCVSVNDEVVHGIPGKDKIMHEGDIVGLDCGLRYEKMCVDSAITVGVGEVSAQAKKLIAVTRDALTEGLRVVGPNARIGDIGHAVEQYVKKNGFTVVRDLAGHGVGYSIHEEPMILNFGKKGTGMQLAPGMTIAIEPMVVAGDFHIIIDDDGWGIRTADGALAAHFEHTVVVTKEGCEILTTHEASRH